MIDALLGGKPRTGAEAADRQGKRKEQRRCPPEQKRFIQRRPRKQNTAAATTTEENGTEISGKFLRSEIWEKEVDFWQIWRLGFG
jgi:hypothetical protein